MKPKTRSRLILLLTFMLARHNVFASINCLSGCQHNTHSSCDATSTGCSEGEICSRFQIESIEDEDGRQLSDMVAMQCMSIEECKTNKEASESDLRKTAANLKVLFDAKFEQVGEKIEFACCNQNDCNSKPVSEMKIEEVEGGENEDEASGAGGLFENHLMFYMMLGSTFIYFSS